MRITNQSFMPSSTNNTKNVKTQEKFQIDKENGTKELSQEEEMEAFKKDFYDELSQITTHRTVSNMAVNISEKAFQAMKDDPAYREKVLSLIKRDCGSSFGTRNCSLLITVGASLNEYRADAWPVDYDSEYHVRSQNSFYKKTRKRKEILEEIQEQYLEKRMLAKELQQSLDNEKNRAQAVMAYLANG